MSVTGATLGLLLVSATVGIRVEASRGIEPETERAMIAELRSALEAAGHSTVLEFKKSETEDGAKREHLVFRVDAALTLMRISAERISENGVSRGHTEVDRPIDGWRGAMASIVGELFGPPSAAPVATQTAPPPAPSSSATAWPWVLGATGLVATAVGVGFAVSSAGKRSEVLADDQFNPRGAAQLASANDDATLAIGLLVGGVALVGVSLVVALVD